MTISTPTPSPVETPRNYNYLILESLKNITSTVFYKTFNENGEVILDKSSGQICFYVLTSRPIDLTTSKIEISHPLSKIPYSEESISKWIAEIAELGFPCSVHFDKNNAYFTIELKYFKYKLLLTSTIQLIHALYEPGVLLVPENYFELLQVNLLQEEKIDKFIALQTAHKLIQGYSKDFGSAASAHMITFKANGARNITKEEFNQKLANTNFLYSSNYSSTTICPVHDLWKIEESAPFEIAK